MFFKSSSFKTEISKGMSTYFGWGEDLLKMRLGLRSKMWGG